MLICFAQAKAGVGEGGGDAEWVGRWMVGWWIRLSSYLADCIRRQVCRCGLYAFLERKKKKT